MEPVDRPAARRLDRRAVAGGVAPGRASGHRLQPVPRLARRRSPSGTPRSGRSPPTRASTSTGDRSTSPRRRSTCPAPTPTRRSAAASSGSASAACPSGTSGAAYLLGDAERPPARHRRLPRRRRAPPRDRVRAGRAEPARRVRRRRSPRCSTTSGDRRRRDRSAARRRPTMTATHDVRTPETPDNVAGLRTITSYHLISEVLRSPNFGNGRPDLPADARHAAGHRRRRAPRAPPPRGGAVHAGGDRAVRAGDPPAVSSTGSSPSAAARSPGARRSAATWSSSGCPG